MELRIRGLVHVVALPLGEPVRVDRGRAIVPHSFTIEVVALVSLQEAVQLAAHVAGIINITYYWPEVNNFMPGTVFLYQIV